MAPRLEHRDMTSLRAPRPEAGQLDGGWGRTRSGQPGYELAAVNAESLAAPLVHSLLQRAVAEPDKSHTILKAKQKNFFGPCESLCACTHASALVCTFRPNSAVG